ncbi:imidazolonepropionase [Bordetella bronchialis]|uniref:Imidazolonepropionase n=1 Tax=Bordetella bronchialis TaxID=463025 RepID=A0A193FYV3_9BORD|nr:imidazolonepropionase [Bordetella bronchialis]ANN67474.1 imidazolonepropionase [Bordetella bronchialis]ANN72563.1 imidazolonepropionase [Bordetella bronchialis]
MSLEPAQDPALIVNARIASFDPAAATPYGVLDGADAIAIRHGRIAWLGNGARVPDAAWMNEAGRPGRCIDAQGAWVMPGLVDCHTHLVYAGTRAREFEMRLNGASYEDIARAGGGIVSTVRATRAAGEAGLVEQALPRLRALLREGVTTVEIKSGYGLDGDTELAMLRAARTLGDRLPVTVRTTFLGAHALPPEYAGRADDYIDFVCTRVLPEAARLGLADAVDVFHESIGFDAAQSERVYRAAAALGLPVKVHAEQLNLCGAAALGARYRALSADHLEHLDEAGARAMAAAGTVAVLLPGAFYFLRDTRVPPVDLLRRHGVPIAVATDCNPGTSPFTSLLLMLNMACTLFRLTPAEALNGVTHAAARALGLQEQVGSVTVGKWADLVFWQVPELAELCYSHGMHTPARILRRGHESLF